MAAFVGSSKASVETRSEERAPVAVAQSGLESVLSQTNLGWNPEDWLLQIQVTAAAANTWQVHVLGPGNVYGPLDDVDYVDNDFVQLRFRFSEVKIVHSGAGAAIAHVIGRKA